MGKITHVVIAHSGLFVIPVYQSAQNGAFTNE
jgi:hypothetical protein